MQNRSEYLKERDGVETQTNPHPSEKSRKKFRLGLDKGISSTQRNKSVNSSSDNKPKLLGDLGVPAYVSCGVPKAIILFGVVGFIHWIHEINNATGE
jgi:hypothetical protein